MTGTIKTIVTLRGFGFLTAPTGVDYFFHRADLADGTEFYELSEGDAVTFEPVEPRPAKGHRAGQVQRAVSAGALHSPGESSA